MTRYAATTEVPVERSRAELERTLARYGATAFAYAWEGDRAMVQFAVGAGAAARRVRFVLPLPAREDPRFTHHARGPRTPEAAEREWEQACRQRWRALNLVVKAKLEAVESGVPASTRSSSPTWSCPTAQVSASGRSRRSPRPTSSASCRRCCPRWRPAGERPPQHPSGRPRRGPPRPWAGRATRLAAGSPQPPPPPVAPAACRPPADRMRPRPPRRPRPPAAGRATTTPAVFGLRAAHARRARRDHRACPDRGRRFGGDLMPLKGLTQRWPELGRLRMGHKVPTAGGKLRPAKLDCWRLTSRSQRALQAAAQRYGGDVRPWADAPKPGVFELYTEHDALDIVVPPEHGFTQAYELWGKPPGARDRDGDKAPVVCLRRCNGVRERLSDAPCLCAAEAEVDDDSGARACKPTSRLSVLLRDVPGLGFWRLDTKGYYAAVELEQTASLLAMVGAMVPATLRIDQRTRTLVTASGKVEARRFPVPVIEVEATIDQLAALPTASGALRAIAAPQLALPAPAPASDVEVAVEVDEETGEVWDRWEEHEEAAAWESAGPVATAPAGPAAANPPAGAHREAGERDRPRRERLTAAALRQAQQPPPAQQGAAAAAPQRSATADGGRAAAPDAAADHQPDAGPPAAGRPASDTPAPAAPADGPSPRSMREVLKRLGISNIAAAEALRDAAFNGQVPAETFGAITARQVLDLDGTALQLAVEFLHAKGVA